MAYPEIELSKPRFSIIMPLFNKEAYVEKAILSVIAQSFNDWELIIVNDGSSDNSFDVAFTTIHEDSRCTIINQKNSGVGAARNMGVKESKGEYLCFLDADDWWERSFLENMVGFMENYQDAGLWTSNYWYVRNGKKRIGVDIHDNGYINYPRTYLLTGNMPVWTGSVCMPRSIFYKYCGFPTNIKIGEDFLLWSKVAMNHKIAFLNKPLAYYYNDIPNSLRLTRNLYEPNTHMLFHLYEIEEPASKTKEAADWNSLFDDLRNKGLLEFWLDKRYHNSTINELQKISISLLPIYSQPIWYVKTVRTMKHIGSMVKHLMKR